MAIAIFVNAAKGISALQLGRDLDVSYKTAFVLAHKLREAMAAEARGRQLGGAGRHVEVDGCYVGGHVRPENRKADRKDRRLAENQSGKRQVVADLELVEGEQGARGRAEVAPARRAAEPWRSVGPRAAPAGRGPGRSPYPGVCERAQTEGPGGGLSGRP